jgi:hypothetical protein
MNAPSRRGPFRRLLAAIAQRCPPFGAAHLPARAPRDAAHWEPETPEFSLPEVALPRQEVGVALPRVAPAASKPVADAQATAPASR